MFNTKMSKVTLLTLTFAFVFAVAFIPAGAMAKNIDLELKLKTEGKVELHDLIEAEGTCKAITIKVKAGKAIKDLSEHGSLQLNSNLKIEVPYQIYWYPINRKAEGKLVADEKVVAATGDQEAVINYLPAKNPNGSAGVYGVKAKLVVNGKIMKELNTTVRINSDCRDNSLGGNNLGVDLRNVNVNVNNGGGLTLTSTGCGYGIAVRAGMLLSGLMKLESLMQLEN